MGTKFKSAISGFVYVLVCCLCISRSVLCTDSAHSSPDHAIGLSDVESHRSDLWCTGVASQAAAKTSQTDPEYEGVLGEKQATEINGCIHCCSYNLE